VRNPVANTHADIDGLFGVLRRFLRNKNWDTLDELVELIRQCFSKQGKVFVEVLQDTLDIKSWLTQGDSAEQALDPDLGGRGTMS